MEIWEELKVSKEEYEEAMQGYEEWLDECERAEAEEAERRAANYSFL